ncbi:MAG: hypothetical protein NC548_51240 [Lachnospiraceae bacterium]|nr:hypothetical protein [Lachnospiraceae bacterium]MCM1236677.1 hypothetical protein [Ruminococcus flavefaciens]
MLKNKIVISDVIEIHDENTINIVVSCVPNEIINEDETFYIGYGLKLDMFHQAVNSSNNINSYDLISQMVNLILWNLLKAIYEHAREHNTIDITDDITLSIKNQDDFKNKLSDIFESTMLNKLIDDISYQVNNFKNN